MPDTCPLSARVARGLAAPGSKLNAELSAHLPQCPACRFAVSDALRRWPAETAPLADWLRDGTNETTITPYQAERLARGTPQELELGPYLVLDLIARGGMGAVYRAWHRLLRREDAVKTVRAEFAANSEAVRRFLREAEAAARLRHPNVVQVYTADRAAGEYYIAMELVNGPDLNRVVRSGGPLAPERARDYIAQAADGLQSALDHGFIHRDMKPGNLLLAPGGVVKVADFGLARALDPLREDGPGTVPGAIMGTPAYMAPEQARGERVDTRADVYALGCTLFFLLTGRTPFDASHGIQLIYAHMHEPVPDVPAPPALAAIVRKCLSKAPEDRYQTPGELAAALRALDVPLAPTVVRPAAPVRDALTDTKPPGVDSTAGTTESVVAPPLPFLPEDEPRGPRPKVMIVAAALVLLLAAVAFVVLMLIRPNPNSNAGVHKKDDTNGSGTQKEDSQKEAQPNVKAEPPRVDPGRVPVPVAVNAEPWVLAGAVAAGDGEKVRAVGLLDTGELLLGREGARPDGSDSAWEVWRADLKARTRAKSPLHAEPSEKALFAHAGGFVTDKFRRYSVADFKPLKPLSADLTKFGGSTAEMIDSMAASGNGKYLVGGITPNNGQVRKERRVGLWVIETGELRDAPVVKAAHDIKAVAIDTEGTTTLAGGEKGELYLFTVTGTGQRKWVAPTVEGTPDPVTAVALATDGKRAFSAHEKSQTVYEWDRAKDLPVALVYTPECSVYQMRVSPNGRWLAVAGDLVAVIDLDANPRTVRTLAKHYAGEFRTVAFDASGTRLVAGGWSYRGEKKPGVGSALVWELKGKE